MEAMGGAFLSGAFFLVAWVNQEENFGRRFYWVAKLKLEREKKKLTRAILVETEFGESG